MNKRYTGVGCNEKFLEITTGSYSGWVTDDPLGEDIYLEPLTDNKIIGEAILKALAKSRDLSETEEEKNMSITDEEWRDLKPDRWLLTPVAAAERYKKWIQKVMRDYGYKTKKTLLQNMQYISVEQDDDFIKFDSLYHLTTDSWGNPDGKTPTIELKIPASSSPEIIGAAMKYAIGNCRGKGADFMRNLLFPAGQPTSFEEYIGALKIVC